MADQQLDRFLRLDEVRTLTTLSRSTLWRMAKSGRFPEPVTITAGRVGWKASAIAAWQADPNNWTPPGAA